MNIKHLLILLILLLCGTILITYSVVVKDWEAMQCDRDLPEIEKEGNKTLNVVTEYNSNDFHKVKDSIAGFQYDLCRFIVRRSGYTIQLFVEKDLETATRKLENKVYDVIAQNISITNENKQYLAFTVPIAQSKQVLVQRKRDAEDSVLFITSQLDLARQTVYVTKNSPTILRLHHLAEEIAEPIYIKEIPGHTSEQLISMVAQKKIDYAVVDKEISLKNIDRFPDLDFNTDISFTQLQAWALRKTSPVLLDSLNVWIMEFKQNKAVIN